jgi:hypothetical protein
MTARASRLASGIADPLSIAGLVDSSLRPGGSISLAFSDGVVQVMLDQTGDWTITAGLSIVSDRLVPLTKALEELGFFQATEQAGMVYHLWTSALHDNDSRSTAENTLLRVLKTFQSHYSPSYIS